MVGQTMHGKTRMGLWLAPWKVSGLSGLLFCLVFLFVPFLCAPSVVHAQGEAASASLAGYILDQQNASVPGAKVTLFSRETGYTREFTSSDSGQYTFTLIPPGRYDVKAEKTGFKTSMQPDVALAVGQVATLNLVLQVGALSQTVEVKATTLALNTSNANVAVDVSHTQLTELPVDYRTPFYFVILKSSVNTGQIYQLFNIGATQSGPGADQDASAFTFGGSRFGSVAFLLDGHWASSGDWGAMMYAPTVEGTQEYKIQEKSFNAQYGLSMGSVVNVVTRSGTNTLHGAVYDFERNNALDANNFFNNRGGISRPAFKRHQFGFTLGGPLYLPHLYQQRDKTFVFGEYSGLREAVPLTLVTTVPTPAMEGGDFSALLGGQIGTDALGRPVDQGQLYNPFTTRFLSAGQTDPVTGLVATQTGYIRDPIPGNNLVTSGLGINSIAKAAEQYYPAPTGSGTVNNYTASIGAPVREDRYSLRVDQNFGEKARLFMRWSQVFEYKARYGAFFGKGNQGGPGEIADNDRWDAGMGLTYTFNPTFLMSITAGGGQWCETRRMDGYPYAPSKLGLPSYFDTLAPQFPQFTIDGIFRLGGDTEQAHYVRDDGTINLDFTKVRGHHSLSFGYQYIGFMSNNPTIDWDNFNFPVGMTQGPQPTAANPATGWGFASFLLGTGNSGGFNIYQEPAYKKPYHGWYVQDEWRITPKFTATVGLRYDLQPSVTERYNRIHSFDFTATNPVSSSVGFNVPGEFVFASSSNRGIYNTDYHTFAPRVSAVYKATDKFVVRAGYGIFFLENGTMGFPGIAGYSQTTPFVGTVDGITPVNTLANPFPTGLIQPPGNSQGALTYVGLGAPAIARVRSAPYINQWTLALEYALSPNDLLTISYVGNHGVKLDYNDVEMDQLNPTYLSQGNALLSEVKNPFYGLISSSSCGLNAPTVPAGQLLLHYPEYCAVDNVQPLGASSWYNGITVEVNHRFSHYLQFLAGYTFSKYLDNSMGDQQWISGAASNFTNWYNLAAEKSYNSNDIPQSFVLSYILEMPFGKGKHFGTGWTPAVNTVLGGWQLTGVTTFKSGPPIGITALTNNTNSFGGGQTANIVGNPSAVSAGVDRVTEWFNTAAFAQPAPFTFGDSARFLPRMRGPGYNDFDFGLQKFFQVKERLKIQFRAEFFNAFNHANFYLPDSTFGDPAFGQLNQAYPARDIQLALKLSF